MNTSMTEQPDAPWVVAAKTGNVGLKNRLGRGDRSPLGVWFWELDRVMLSLLLGLIAVGLLAVAAASPAGAQRLSTATVKLPDLYFFFRQLMWVAIAIPVMLFISMYPREQARKLGIVGFAVMLCILMLVPFLGKEVNGAQRWIGWGPATIQPSEFLKPCFAITLAWILTWKAKDYMVPRAMITLGVTGFVGVLLLAQPDLGQTILCFGIWFALMMVYGIPAWRLWALVLGGAAFFVLAYNVFPHVQIRFDAWFFGTEGITHDKMALATLTAGGLIGAGPGLGTRKFSLPEAQTDYIFSVIGEEFGLLACLAVVLLFLAILLRAFLRMLDEKDQFVVFAVTGLTTQFVGQAMINISVNLGIIPSKGMTLPFVSYGGSSIIALAVTTGFILALTKRNPYLDRSRYLGDGHS